MSISEARVSHLAHRVKEGLWRDDLVDYRDDALALEILKETLAAVLIAEEESDRLVRDRLQRQNQIPGSREWQVLYERYFRDEMAKRGR